MKLIVGLGNPGAQYERTRHNAGFLAVDRLAQRHAAGGIARSRFHSATIEASLGSGGERCLLMKPLTYMNRSGLAVADAVRFYKIDPAVDVLIIVDDVYLPSGSIRLRADGSPGGHNGLVDVQRALGSDRWARCRIGVDMPGMASQADYVLGRFSEEQWPAVDGAIDRACGAAEVWAGEGIAAAMNRFNVKVTAEGAAPRRSEKSRPSTDSGASPESQERNQRSSSDQ